MRWQVNHAAVAVLFADRERQAVRVAPRAILLLHEPVVVGEDIWIPERQKFPNVCVAPGLSRHVRRASGRVRDGRPDVGRGAMLTLDLMVQRCYPKYF